MRDCQQTATGQKKGQTPWFNILSLLLFIGPGNALLRITTSALANKELELTPPATSTPDPVLKIRYHGYHGRGTKGIWGDQRDVIVFLKTKIYQEVKTGET